MKALTIVLIVRKDRDGKILGRTKNRCNKKKSNGYLIPWIVPTVVIDGMYKQF
jgi:hypothetical protein